MRTYLSVPTTNPDIPGARIQIADLYTFDRIWSLQKVRGGYGGPCVELRRTSDSALQTFGFGGDGVLDWAAVLSWVGAGSAYVRTWFDQSEAGCHLQQTTVGNQPRLVNAGVPDEGMWFDGTYFLRAETAGLYASVFGVVDGLTWVSGEGSATGHIFAETNAAAANGRYIPLSRVSGGDGARAGAYVITDGGTTVAQASKESMFTGAKRQLTAIDTGSVLTFRGDGAGGAPISYNRGTLTPTTTVIGGRVHTSGGTNSFRGHIHEILARTVVTPTADMLKIEANQRTRLIPG